VGRGLDAVMAPWMLTKYFVNVNESVRRIAMADMVRESRASSSAL
jgi:hypothetical protein